MASDGRLELEFVDVHSMRLTEPVDISVRHRVLSDQRSVERADATKVVALDGLRREPQGLHILEVSSRSYHPVRRFVTIPASGVKQERVTLPIRSDRAKGVFPEYDQLDDRVKGVLERSTAVERHENLTGHALYQALREEEKAGLLNIAKKSLATGFKSGGDLIQHVTLRKIVGDRCLVDVPDALISQMPELVDGDFFRSVDGSLHDPPNVGFVPEGSFKTLDAFGNLQLTFFRKGTACCADVDIDDAAGLGHVFQVVRNHVTGDPTHPFNIHQILMKHQHLDPGYRLVPKS